MQNCSIVLALNFVEMRPDKPRDELVLPEDCPDWGELNADGFAEKYCGFYGLNFWQEKHNYSNRKIGADGLRALFMDYQAKRRVSLATKQRRLLGAGTLAVAALALADQQLDLHDQALNALESAVHPAPLAYVPYKLVPGLNSVDPNAEDIPLDSEVQSWLIGCHAEAYVLTDCTAGRNAHDKFFRVEGENGYLWAEASMGQVASYGSYVIFTSDFDHDYHPISPGPAAQCKSSQDGVFIAPIVPASVENLSEECTAQGVMPLPRKGIFENF